MNKITEFFRKLFKDEKSIKDVLNFVISLVFILAAALLIFNVFSNKEEDDRIIFDSDSKYIDEENLYMNDEQRLSDILSNVRGVGEAKVMLTYGFDEHRNEVVEGVIIVAQGAADPIIKDKIIMSAQSAFDIPVSRIIVLERK